MNNNTKGMKMRSDAWHRGFSACLAQPGNPYAEGTKNHSDFHEGQRAGYEFNRQLLEEIEREEQQQLVCMEY
jgi:hypothetical protein